MMCYKKKRNKCTLKKELDNMDNDNGQLCISVEDDRLSSLPDNLLISILMLIPFSCAVATSVLSHRWRHLWTYLTHIFFHGKSITTINHVISKLNSPKIHTFHLEEAFFSAQEQACLAPSIHEICLRNPEVITIGFHTLSYGCHLSASLFQTHSLVELSLDSLYEFDFAADVEIVINLPNLKILEIYLCDSHRHLMNTLFKSCPLLEQLCLGLNLKENGHHVDILAHNLKFLSVDGYSRNCSLLIDAPKLVILETYELISPGFFHFVTNLRRLLDAKLIIPKYHDGASNDYVSRILALLQAISRARSVTFKGCFHDILLEATLPSFPNLVDVDLDFDDIVLDSSSWMPSCLLSNVKIIRIYDMKPNYYGIRVLEGILRNGTVLEQLHVSLCDYAEDVPLKIRVWEEYEFSMKLFNLDTSSPSCHIELSGEIISASCEDFKYGQLTCKLEDLTYVDSE